MKLTKSLWFVLCALLMGSLAMPAFAQDEGEMDAEALANDFLAAFNNILVEDYEARALARNEVLDGVAQELANQIGCNDERVEFDIQQSVKDAGYAAYPGENFPRTTRIPLVPAVNVRPVEEVAQFYAPDIFESNINQAGRFYREIGIGIVPCIAEEGADAVGTTQQYALFIILGSQPDVIPVVASDGSGVVEGSAPTSVSVSIHQESTRQLPGIFGRGASIRVSPDALDDSVEAIAYGSPIEVELSECGVNDFFYELTDTNDMVIEGSFEVELVCP
jgi:hypothetical protein